MELLADNICKSYSKKIIFKDISFRVNSGQSLAITGSNGTGKTTLLKILTSLIRADKGSVTYNDISSTEESFKNHFSLVGPYLQLYEELTAIENLVFCAKIKKCYTTKSMQKINSLLEMVGLKNRGDDLVREYSSGMKQRLKYAFALLPKPDILFLDEPTSNLDKQGMNIVYNIMQDQKKDKILVFATNDEKDLEYADRVVKVDA